MLSSRKRRVLRGLRDGELKVLRCSRGDTMSKL
jgi:hypothetical protein